MIRRSFRLLPPSVHQNSNVDDPIETYRNIVWIYMVFNEGLIFTHNVQILTCPVKRAQFNMQTIMDRV